MFLCLWPDIFRYICQVHVRFVLAINRKDSHPPGPFAMTFLNSDFIHKNFPNGIDYDLCIAVLSRATVFIGKYTRKF